MSTDMCPTEMKPLMLCDGLPDWVLRFFSMLPNTPSMEEEALVFSLVTLMYETGFYLADTEPNTTGTFEIALMKQLPAIVSMLKNDGSYKFTFAHKSAIKSVSLVVIPVDQVLLVNLMASELKVESLILTTSEFISSNPSISIETPNVLSLSFKRHVYSIKSFLLDDLLNSHHILHLPVEVQTLICEYLSPKDFINFGTTCKTINNFLDYDNIWKCLARAYFPSRKTDSQESWKKFVKYQFEMEKKMKTTFFGLPSMYFIRPLHSLSSLL